MAHPQPDIETKARNKFRRRTKVSLIGNFFAATKKDQAGRSGYENEGLHLYKVIFFYINSIQTILFNLSNLYFNN